MYVPVPPLLLAALTPARWFDARAPENIKEKDIRVAKIFMFLYKKMMMVRQVFSKGGETTSNT